MISLKVVFSWSFATNFLAGEIWVSSSVSDTICVSGMISESGTFVSISVFGTTSISRTTSVSNFALHVLGLTKFSRILTLSRLHHHGRFLRSQINPSDVNKYYPWFDLCRRAQSQTNLDTLLGVKPEPCYCLPLSFLHCCFILLYFTWSFFTSSCNSHVFFSLNASPLRLLKGFSRKLIFSFSKTSSKTTLVDAFLALFPPQLS